MICTNCGQKLTDKATFCMKCGKATSPEVSNKDSQPSNLDQKWWLRLARVLYIGLYIPLFVLIAVLVVLSLNEIRESLKEKRQQKELKARYEDAMAGNIEDATRLAEIFDLLKQKKASGQEFSPKQTEIFELLNKKAMIAEPDSGDRGFSPFFARGVTVLRIFLIVFAWMAVLRLMKIVFLYIALAQKPEWKKEFKKLF